MKKKTLTLIAIMVLVLSLAVFSLAGCEKNAFKGVDTESKEVFSKLSKMIDKGETFELEYNGALDIKYKVIVNEEAFEYKNYGTGLDQIYFIDGNSVTMYQKDMYVYDSKWEYITVRNGKDTYNDMQELLLDGACLYLDTASETRWKYNKKDKSLYTSDNGYAKVGKDSLLIIGEATSYIFDNISNATKLIAPKDAEENKTLEMGFDF